MELKIIDWTDLANAGDNLLNEDGSAVAIKYYFNYSEHIIIIRRGLGVESNGVDIRTMSLEEYQKGPKGGALKGWNSENSQRRNGAHWKYIAHMEISMRVLPGINLFHNAHVGEDCD